MLINDLEELTDEDIKTNYSAEVTVEFVRYYDYDRYCSLCHGILELNINNNIISFGSNNQGHLVNFPSFFSPTVCFANADIDKKVGTSWETDISLLPPELKPFAKKIDEVINQNMPTHICRGCD